MVYRLPVEANPRGLVYDGRGNGVISILFQQVKGSYSVVLFVCGEECLLRSVNKADDFISELRCSLILLMI